ncbi:hypothetical protein ACVXZ4_04040 [Lacisediminihabitans sp. FW035]
MIINKTHRRVIAAITVTALSIGGLIGGSAAASAAEPLPPITSTVAWQTSSTITDNSGVIASYSETRNQTGPDTYTYNGQTVSYQPDPIRFHVGQTITLTTDVKLNSDVAWWVFNNPAATPIQSIFFNPYAKLESANWSALSCNQPASFAANSGIVEFSCSTSMKIPTTAPLSYNTTTNVRSTYGVPTMTASSGTSNLFYQTFRPAWLYVIPASELIPAKKEFSMKVGDQLTISPQMLIAGVTDASGAPADADGVSVKSTPTGAVVSPNQTITYTATQTGRFAFAFTLSNSESKVTSAVSPGGIVAGDLAPPAAPVITPAPQNYPHSIGDSITLDLPTVSAGCTISNGDICKPDSVVFSTLPPGATIDGGGAFVWTPTSAGVFTVGMVLSQSSDGAKSALTPVVITVTAVPTTPVTPPVVTPPVVTPPAAGPTTPATPASPVVPLPMVTG